MTIEELEAELETVKRDLGVVTILEDGREIVSVGNLLAVIHGDGGHYALAHGWGRAIIDAEAVVVALRAELETVKKDRDWFVAQCGELHANLNKAAEALEFERQNARDEQERASRILRELRQLVRAERERDEARAEAKELREVLTLAGERLKACSYQLTEFSYQEMASVLFDLPCNTEEPTNG